MKPEIIADWEQDGIPRLPIQSQGQIGRVKETFWGVLHDLFPFPLFDSAVNHFGSCELSINYLYKEENTENKVASAVLFVKIHGTEMPWESNA